MVGAINEDSFKDLLKNYPQIKYSFIIQSRKYKDYWKMFQISRISSIDYLADLPFNLKEEIHYKFQLTNYEQGAKIIERGSECKAIYFLVSGEIELVIEQGKREHQLEELGPGSIIGQYSVINESIFPYTAKATTDLTLLIITRSDLLSFVDTSEHFSDAIASVTQIILENEVPVLDYVIVKPA